MDFFLKNLINLNYYTGTIPFKIKLHKIRNTYGEEESWYNTEENLVQKIICRSLLALNVLQGLFLARGSYWAKVVEHPSVLFWMWMTVINGTILGAIWARDFPKKKKQLCLTDMLQTFLKRREKLEVQMKIMSHSVTLVKPMKYPGAEEFDRDEDEVKEEGCNLTEWFSGFGLRRLCLLLIILFFGLVFPIGSEIVQVLDIDGGPSLRDNFRISSAQILYDLFLIRNSTYISEEQFGNLELGICISYMVLRTYGKVLLGMAHLFTFFSAMVAYQEVSRCRSVVLQRKDKVTLLRKMLLSFLQTRRIVRQLNEVNRPIFLCLVSASVPLFVLRLIGGWDSNQVSVKIIVLIKLSQYLIILIVAGEANYKAFLLKRELLEICHQRNEGRWSGRIYRSELAIDAGRFVKISFSFVGSMLSAYLSYAIMLLQTGPVE